MRCLMICLTALIALPAFAAEPAPPLPTAPVPASSAPPATSPTTSEVPATASVAPAAESTSPAEAATPAFDIQPIDSASTTQQERPTLALSELALMTELPEGTKRIDIGSGDDIRSFLMHVPKALPRLASLVFSFHPEGLTAADQERLTGLSALADQAGFIVVYPEGRGERQNWAIKPEQGLDADLAFVENIISYVAQRHGLQSKAIFASGLGNGAVFAARIGCNLPERFAAVGLVGGNYPQWTDCIPRPISTIIFHGTNDAFFPYGGRALIMGPRGHAERMARANKCTAGPGSVFNKEDTEAVAWGSCLAGTEILLFTFKDRGHSWPGSSLTPPADTSMTINASETMWNFFKTHPQQRYRMPRQPK